MNGIDISRFQQCCERMGGEYSEYGGDVTCRISDGRDAANIKYNRETNVMVVEDESTEINMLIIPVYKNK